MAQIKIEITFDPSKETLAQAIAGLQGNSPAPTVQKDEKPAAKTETKKPIEFPTAAPTETTPAPAATEAPAAGETAGDKPAASPSESSAEETPKPVSKTDVRAVATALSKAGKRDELKNIFAKFGGTKLSDIKEADYPALMKELEAANG